MGRKSKGSLLYLLLIPSVLVLLGGCAATNTIPSTTPDNRQAESRGTATGNGSDTGTQDFFDPIPNPSSASLYFQPGDVIQFRISGREWGGKYKIPPSGVIDLEFIGPYQIASKTAEQVREELHDRLTPNYFIDPHLQVNFEKISETRILVLGEVQKPDHVLIKRGEGIMDALAEVGSLTQYSHRTDMYVFRNADGDTSIYRVNYEEYARGDIEHNLVLRNGDLVYVQTNFWPHFDRLKDVLQPLGFGVNTLATLRFIEDL